MTQTVGIAGAGVLGRLLALELARTGWLVTLYDRCTPQDQATCSWVGAGMLAPIVELDVAEPIITELGLESLARWPEILAGLPVPVFFQRAGSLVVAHRQDRAELAKFERRLVEKKPGTKPYRVLDGDALAQMEAELGQRFRQALYFPEEGQIEPRQLMPALLKAAQDEGIQCRFQCEIHAVLPGKIQFESGMASHDWVIDARGLGARPQWPSLRGVRGELIRCHAPEVKLSRPVRLLHPRYPLYIVPRPNGEFIIGATSIESELRTGVTLQSALELLSAAYSVHSGFAEAELTDMLVQVRPALPDHLPKLLVEPGRLQINGLYRHGFLLTPVLVQAALTYLNGERKKENPTLWEVETYARAHG